MRCNEFEQLSLLYVYDELAAGERADFEAHVAGCEACRRELAKVERLHATLRDCPRPEPSPEMLAQCRVSLDDALDREQLGWRAMLRSWLWGFGALPATRAAAVTALAVFAFGLGWMLRPRVPSLAPTTAGEQAGAAATPNLDNYRIRSINQISPDPQSGDVRVTLDAERRVTLEGSLDNPQIRKLLVDAVKNYDNPGIRRDTLDALRMDTQNPQVREALMYALHDANPGVRLAALDTVNHMACGDDTHQGLLEVVETDPNIGVRTAAIDALVQHLEVEGPDDLVIQGFTRLAVTGSDPSVRMRCLAALRKIEGME